MKLLRFLLRASWRTVVLAALAGAAAGGSGVALVATINHLVYHPDAPPRAIAVLVGAALCLVASSVCSSLLVVRLTHRSVERLRVALAQRALAAPLAQLEALGAPRLTATLTEDVSTVAEAMSVVPVLGTNVAIVCAVLAYITLISFKVLLALVGFSVAAVLIVKLLLRHAHRQFERARDAQDVLFRHLRAVTEGTKELKLHRRHRQVLLEQGLASSARTNADARIAGDTVAAATSSLSDLFLLFAIGLVLLVVRPLAGLTEEVVSGTTLALFYVLGPMAFIMATLPMLERSEIALRKIELLGESLEHDPGSDVVPPPPSTSWDALELHGVVYVHPAGSERAFTLGPIDLAVRPGTIVFLVGGNGSGKSTLGKVLAGLYAPTDGDIYLDGQRINDENREWYRQHFSAVFSDFYLVENLRGVDLPDLDERARKYLVKLRLEDKVCIEGGTFTTTALSQGQRKRLALLTTYLEDRPIYLFDEWAADQDPVFKTVFYTQLLPELRAKGKAVIVISHDDRFFHLADELVKLEEGRVTTDATSQFMQRMSRPVSVRPPRP